MKKSRKICQINGQQFEQHRDQPNSQNQTDVGYGSHNHDKNAHIGGARINLNGEPRNSLLAL